MKQAFVLSGLVCAVISCTKPSTNPTLLVPPTKDTTTTNINQIPVDTTDTTTTFPVVIDSFTSYIIPAGAFYVNGNVYSVFSQQSLKFKVVFDSSCIYTTVDPQNQADINKLYGFSDCGTHHHTNSARFGWNWQDGQMHIHAYCYADSVRLYKELGTVALNQEHTCTIEALPGMYVFTLNGQKDTMQRHCTNVVATGYKLLPYFGGTEPAPHEVRIKIREIN